MLSVPPVARAIVIFVPPILVWALRGGHASQYHEWLLEHQSTLVMLTTYPLFSGLVKPE